MSSGLFPVLNGVVFIGGTGFQDVFAAYDVNNDGKLSREVGWKVQPKL